MDKKIMVETPDKPGRTVPVAKETSTPAVPGDYHEYAGSQNKAYALSYDSDMPKLSAALGLKGDDKS